MKKYIALTALPLGVLIILICRYAVDLPVGDEWLIITLLDKFHSGALSFWDFFAQHNEHRIVLGKIIILANAILLHWNIYIELVINVLFSVGTSIIMFRMIECLDSLSETKKMILYFVSACLIFSFSQYENWLTGFQMQIFMCVFFTVLSAFTLQNHIIIAVISAVLASFSFANGLMVWPAGLIALFIQTYSSGQKKYGKVILWLILMTFVGILYFYDFNQAVMPQTFTEKITFTLKRLHVFIILFAAFLGSPLSEIRLTLALGAGLLGLIIQACSLILIVRRKQWNDNYSFWIFIDLFVILSGAVTAFGRIASLAGTTASRYISISILFWICTITIAAHALEFMKNNIPVKLYFMFTCIILILSVNEEHIILAREYNQKITLFKEQMKRGEYDDYTFMKLFHRCNAKRINLCREYGVRHFENAPVIDEFNDFTEIEFDRNVLIHDNDVIHVDSFELLPENYFSLTIWHKMKSNDCWVILYGNDKAFITDMHKTEDKGHLVSAKRQNAYEVYTRNYFSAEWLYYGNLPVGTYNVAVEVAGKYYPVNGITITIR